MPILNNFENWKNVFEIGDAAGPLWTVDDPDRQPEVVVIRRNGEVEGGVAGVNRFVDEANAEGLEVQVRVFERPETGELLKTRKNELTIEHWYKEPNNYRHICSRNPLKFHLTTSTTQ